MGSLEALSEALLDTLKELSAEKRPITTAVLKKAFSARQDILLLLCPESAMHAAKRSPVPGNRPARVALPESETLKRSGVAGSSLPESETIEILPALRNLLLKFLDNIGPAGTGCFEGRFYELQNEINECQSLSPLCLLGGQIGEVLCESIDRTIETMEYSNGFLVELGKDLCRMEEQLSAYQNYNLESSQIDSEFHNNLLLQTDDLNRVFTSDENQQDTYKLILSKLKTISKAIELKEQSDVVRLQEANNRIANLQYNLSIYNQEILKITEQAEILEKEVLLDGLTKIHNRRAYDLEIRRCLRQYHRIGEKFSLILIDIDHFKRINEDYGHVVGDKCLIKIAQLIKSSLRQSDFLARYGGEELVAILYGSNSANALDVAEKIRRTIEETRFHYLDEIISLTVSLGVTEVLPDDTEPEIPFDRVDKAMYRAKKEGRNRISEAAGMPLRQ